MSLEKKEICTSSTVQIYQSSVVKKKEREDPQREREEAAEAAVANQNDPRKGKDR